MDDERLPERLCYGNVATGFRRQGGQIRRYKDTLKSPLRRLQINPANWGDLARDRPTRSRTVKIGTAIYKANNIATAKAKREARKSQLCPVRNANAQLPPTCPRCHRAFRAPIGLVGDLPINCTTRIALTVVPPPTSSSSYTPSTNPDRLPEPPLLSSPSFLSCSSSSSSPTTQRLSSRRLPCTSTLNTVLTQQQTPKPQPPR
ncbi:hypothetical protein SprV_0802514500 [Sparganum proliferum]